MAFVSSQNLKKGQSWKKASLFVRKQVLAKQAGLGKLSLSFEAIVHDELALFLALILFKRAVGRFETLSAALLSNDYLFPLFFVTE